MKDFNFSLPTSFYFGCGCLGKNGNVVSGLGRRAFLVTGGTGAKTSGALDDMTSLLSSLGVEWVLFDKAEQNPSLATCITGGRAARAFGADFIAGIGGGSALDAAKAIAVIAANGIESGSELFKPFIKSPLPVVAVPTTAGTGSEGNGIAVLTDGSLKRSIKDARCFPKFSFVDPGYLKTLPPQFTMNCALDALCHTIESFLALNATRVSELIAMRGLSMLWNAINALNAGRLDDKLFEELSIGATLGGVAIHFTGTALPHPMGYNLTMLKGIHHGAATAAFLPYYLDRCMTAIPKKMAEITDELKVFPNEIGGFVKSVNCLDIDITEDEAASFALNIAGSSQFTNIPFAFSESDIKGLYLSLFG